MTLPPWTATDFKEFAAEHPQQASQIQKLRTAGLVWLGGGLTSSLLSAAMVFRKSRNVFYSITAGGLSGIAGFLSMDVITDICFETRSIDAYALNKEFLNWWRRKCNL